MITVAMTTVIGAARECVWRALTTPEELLRWDDRLVELLQPANGYPCVGEAVCWRYRLGPVAVVLRDCPIEVTPLERLRSALELGLFRYAATHTLTPESGAPDRTKLAVTLAAQNSVPVVGGRLDRFDVRRFASELADAKLRSLQKWCEAP